MVRSPCNGYCVAASGVVTYQLTHELASLRCALRQSALTFVREQKFECGGAKEVIRSEVGFAVFADGHMIRTHDFLSLLGKTAWPK